MDARQSKVTDEGLEHVSLVAESLRSLSLAGCTLVGDAGMNHLACARCLTDLDVSGTRSVPVSALPACLGINRVHLAR